MSELRDLVIDAHGGIARWNKVKTIEGDMSITGGLWMRKGWPDVLKNVMSPLPPAINGSATGRSSARPCAVRARLTKRAIETLDGKPVKDRRSPRAAFDGHTVETPWDDLNLAYFSGYAMWNYLTTPFIFALPGFKTEEIEPWDENGEKRRRLDVTFPDHIATHCSEQVFHINGEGLICRMDYSAPVAGGAPTAHYLSDHRDFDGFKVATKRQALRRKTDGTALPDPVFVAIDIARLSFS